MIQVIALGGEPATGKTTLMRAMLARFARGVPSKFGLLHYLEFPHRRSLVLGIYDEHPFSGTDRLSMAVQPHAEGFLERFAKSPLYHGWSVLFEGDRLFNRKFLSFTRKVAASFHGYLLVASDIEKERRHFAREDTQSAGWLRGRAKKYAKLEGDFALVRLAHDFPQQTDQWADFLSHEVATFEGHARDRR